MAESFPPPYLNPGSFGGWVFQFQRRLQIDLQKNTNFWFPDSTGIHSGEWVEAIKHIQKHFAMDHEDGGMGPEFRRTMKEQVAVDLNASADVSFPTLWYGYGPELEGSAVLLPPSSTKINLPRKGRALMVDGSIYSGSGMSIGDAEQIAEVQNILAGFPENSELYVLIASRTPNEQELVRLWEACGNETTQQVRTHSFSNKHQVSASDLLPLVEFTKNLVVVA